MIRKIGFVGILLFFFLDGCKGRNGKSELIRDSNSKFLKHSEQYRPDSVNIANFFSNYPRYIFWKAEVVSFYSQRGYNYIWYDTIGLNERAFGLMNLLSSEGESQYLDSIVDHNRFDSLYYSCYEDKCSYDSWDIRKLELELLFTINFFEYASKKWKGISDEDFKRTGWLITRKKMDVLELLEQNLKDNFDKCLENEPLFFQYNLLKAELKKLNRLSDSGEWPVFQDSIQKLKLNDLDSGLLAIKKALYLLGDLNLEDSQITFDSPLILAIKKYQLRHGINATGILDKETFQSIKIKPLERAKTILINMERCRWVPKIIDPDFVIVNIPEYKLHFHTNHKMDWSCNIVVGKGTTETVIFSNKIQYVVFSPYWVVPQSIIIKEMLPQIKRNINYLSNHNLEVVSFKGEVLNPASINWSKYHGSYFPFMIRQKPGPENSLGLVKFLFPNSHNIYLHDSPSKNLFEKQDRAFSHGCIRIQEPFKMAKHLLRDQQAYTDEKITQLMNAGAETIVTLKKPVPVMITYFTSWVDGDGQLQMRKDVYGHDKRMADILFKNN